MPEVTHNALPKLLAEIKGGTISPVYLLHGDEFLYKAAFKSLLDALLPARDQGLNYEPLDGDKENAYRIVERLNTFPLIPSAKVIAVHGTKAFHSLVAADEFLRKSRDAYEMKNFEEAARYLLYVLSLAGVSMEDLRDGSWTRVFDKELAGSVDMDGTPWVGEVVAFCVKERITISSDQDDAEVLNDAILKGYPETNHLILTTDIVDKRRKLYKTIKKVGVVIDCSIPKGDRKADKQKQQDALKHHTKAALTPARKMLAPGTFEVLYERVGSDMRRFNSELEKLISFVGDRKEILPSDVEEVSKRTKEDPIYEMSSAIADRDWGKALFYLHSLLKNNIHPLQVLAAAANQVRKLLLAKDLVRGKYGRGWRQGISYGAFQKTVLPQLQEHESGLLAGKAHPYATYMTLKQSDNYTFEELTSALETLLDTDVRLKRSGQNPKLVLERAVLQICGT
ncbi:MAG: DNA polymerase III subunit delta [Deltaproteobacteria bacterium]|nr:DNA polymerase III subunit delta [Deltaproteobacteria bacterium]